MTLASMMVGWGARQGLREHLDLLRQLRLGLELMAGEMELNMPPLSQLFETVGQGISGAVGEFLLGTGTLMAAVPGRPPQTAMKLQLERQPLNLTAEEIAMVMELGGALGRYDLGGQARLLELYRRRVDGMIQVAEGAKNQKSRAWMTASVCSGLILVLLML